MLSSQNSVSVSKKYGNTNCVQVKFAQHFLIDKNIAKKIVDSAELSKKDVVIEIGPGKGILTEFIINRVKKLICVEIDKNLTEYLNHRFKNFNHFEVINTDFLSWQLPEEKVKYISNIPYYLTSPILEKVLSSKNWTLSVLMVQKEVADRILANPGTKQYGALTLLVRFYSAVEKLLEVKRSCFKPQPEVDSAVLRFTPHSPPISTSLRDKISSQEFFKFAKSVFAHRRKTVLNSIHIALDIKKEVLKKKLLKLSIKPDMRPEELTFEKFLYLAVELKEKNLIKSFTN